MFVVSLDEPYSSCMATFGADGKPLKTVETRGHPLPAKYLNVPLAIHATKRWTRAQQQLARELSAAGIMPEYNRISFECRLGHILCVVIVHAITQVNKSLTLCGRNMAQERLLGNFSEGRWLWLTKDMRRIKPVMAPPGVFHRGIWQVPDELIQYEDSHA